MTSSPDSSRREFLTGRAVQKEIRRAGDNLADALAESANPSIPQAGDTVRLETRAMGCPWCVVMNPGPPRQVMVATDAFDVVRDVEQMLTIYRNDSEVSLLNERAFAAECGVSQALLHFLKTCRQLTEETEQAFDPASGRLIQLWKQTRLAGRIPTEVEVRQALGKCGMNHIVLDEQRSTVRFECDLLLDFASIGKGLGIDRAAEHLQREQIDSCLIHGGFSSLYARGEHNGLPGWPIGLKNPLFTEQRYATLLVCNQGLSTSGSNVQYFRYHGKRYGHLLDPRTGWPAEGLLSVTVLAPTAAGADALSTAFYVMGLDKAVQYCDDHPEVGAILVPPPVQGRLLEPIVKNISVERLYVEGEVAPQFQSPPNDIRAGSGPLRSTK